MANNGRGSRPGPLVPAPRRNFRRFWAFGVYLLVLSLLFARPLRDLISVASRSQLHSHILLIPLVSAYLIYVSRERLEVRSIRSVRGGGAMLILGLAVLGVALGSPLLSAISDQSNHLALIILAFVSFVAAGGFLLLGGGWMRVLAFPFGFLIFFVPLPDQVVSWLEKASQVASADAADLFFHISGTPILRDGMVFQLPGMVIEVAQECSGIRSSLVLFITSLMAGYLFLNSNWRRFFLVAFVIPLGILRNGIRIVVIGLLCVHYGPQMIHSVIHRKGGPFFFVVSLVPLFLLLWWLWRGETERRLRS